LSVNNDARRRRNEQGEQDAYSQANEAGRQIAGWHLLSPQAAKRCDWKAVRPSAATVKFISRAARRGRPCRGRRGGSGVDTGGKTPVATHWAAVPADKSGTARTSSREAVAIGWAEAATFSGAAVVVRGSAGPCRSEMMPSTHRQETPMPAKQAQA
jgi:hypothetical protein